MLDIILIVISALLYDSRVSRLYSAVSSRSAYCLWGWSFCTSRIRYNILRQLIVWLLIVAVLQVLDYFTPMLGSKYSGGSKWGNWGCIIGTLVGLLFLALGHYSRSVSRGGDW